MEMKEKYQSKKELKGATYSKRKKKSGCGCGRKRKKRR